MRKIFFISILVLIFMITSCSSEIAEFNADDSIVKEINFNTANILNETSTNLSFEDMLRRELWIGVLYMFDNMGENHEDSVILRTFAITAEDYPLEYTNFDIALSFGNAIHNWQGHSMYNNIPHRIFQNMIAYDGSGYFYIAVQEYDSVSIKQFDENAPQEDGGRGNVPTFIREMNPHMFFNFFAVGDKLIIFEIIVEENRLVYQTTRLDTNTLAEEIIFEHSFSFENNAGHFVSNIFVENQSIYAFRTKVADNEAEVTFIDSYDFYGNLVHSYIIDTEDFMLMDEVNDMDTVVAVFKAGKYFILETMHSRTGIFGRVGDQLVEIEIPDSLQRIGSARPVRNWNLDTPYVYFWNYATHSLYVFDVGSQVFHRVHVNVDAEIDDRLFEYQIPLVSYVYRSPRGDIIFRVDSDRRYREFWDGDVDNNGFGSRFLFSRSLEQIEEIIASN